MAIRMADVPASDRPRERLEKLGAASLRDTELVALVLRSGSRGANAVDTAGALLAEHGSLGGLATALLDGVLRSSGIGPAKTASLVAAFELGRRASIDGAEGRIVRGPDDVAAAVRPLVGHPRREEAFVVIVGAANRIKHVRKIAEGGADRCDLTPRDVLGAVLRLDGAAFVLAHTHPSGDVAPSPEDIALTFALQRAAAQVGVVLLDHVVVGAQRAASLRRLGLMD